MNEQTGAPVALDVWLKFPTHNNPDCDNATSADPRDCGSTDPNACESCQEWYDSSEYEANTYRTPETDHHRAGYRVEWYHTAVGLVSSRWFPTYDDAREWLTSEGFEDFSS